MSSPTYTTKTIRALRAGASVLGHGKWTVLVRAQDPQGRAVTGRIVWVASGGVGVVMSENTEVETIQVGWIQHVEVI